MRREALTQQLVGASHPPRVLLLTCGALGRDAAHGGTWGFARVVRLEHASLRASSADVSRGPSFRALRTLAVHSFEALADETDKKAA